MMILIKNVDVYGPASVGVKDILICGEKIEFVAENIDIEEKYVTTIDGAGRKAIPGIIDQHVHITGGGGEGGFSTRAPELRMIDLIEAGVTTVVGLLGTDASTRSVANLVAKTKTINEQGFTAFCLTGSYRYPSPTITDSVRNDIVFIQEIIGCKIAISDHRSSQLTAEELTRLASEVKVAGMLSGKPQMLTVHMGDGKAGLSPIFNVVADSDLPINVFRPTHLNRSERLLEESFEFARRGGYVDYTCGPDDNERLCPSAIIKAAREAGVPLNKITLTSDGFGSFSTYDQEGNLERIGIASLKTAFDELKHMAKAGGVSLAEALPFMTTNVAAGLKLSDTKGKLESGFDADILILDEKFDINTFIARGKVMKKDGDVIAQFPFE
jgi:beta-aspartyl-dipeptidase (metallo-type)